MGLGILIFLDPLAFLPPFPKINKKESYQADLEIE